MKHFPSHTYGLPENISQVARLYIAYGLLKIYLRRVGNYDLAHYYVVNSERSTRDKTFRATYSFLSFSMLPFLLISKVETMES